MCSASPCIRFWSTSVGPDATEARFACKVCSYLYVQKNDLLSETYVPKKFNILACLLFSALKSV